jgi:hypothetical protein
MRTISTTLPRHTQTPSWRCQKEYAALDHCKGHYQLTVYRFSHIGVPRQTWVKPRQASASDSGSCLSGRKAPLYPVRDHLFVSATCQAVSRNQRKGASERESILARRQHDADVCCRCLRQLSSCLCRRSPSPGGRKNVETSGSR